MKKMLFATLMIAVGWTSTASATVTLYTDYGTWLAAMDSVESFTTNASNIAKANEVGGAPGANAQLGNVLTFETANTGLSNGFRLRTLQPGAGFTYWDTEGNANWNNALSVGDINNYENDDWILDITGGQAGLRGFGFTLIDNHGSNGELLFANGQAVSLNGLGFSTFVGIVTDFDITQVRHDEDPGGDDIALKHFQFGYQAVPAPSVLLLLGLGLVGLGFRRR